MYEQFFELLPDIRRNIVRNAPAAVEPDAERAQAIVEELIDSLDFSVEMSLDLGAIYFYVRDLMMEANLKFSEELWGQVESVMRPVYEGFVEAARQVADGNGPGSAADPLGVPADGAPAIVAGVTYGQGRLAEVVVNTKAGLRV